MTVVINCKHALLLSVFFTIFISVLSDVKEETSLESERENTIDDTIIVDDRKENTIDETIVEFKTQSPPDPLEDPKNCYEYLYGKLSAIRKHGATWQNGVADCSNCTCDNGDIRCFFHFCNGPSMGYMTPPTTEEDLILSPPSTEEDITEDLVSSGQRPREVDEEDEGTEEDTTLKVNLKTEGSRFDGDRSLSDSGADGEEKDRTENETHHIYKAFFCDKTCKKSCPQGFKVDRVAGCWKCQCSKCPTHVTCETKCPLGYSMDFNGCQTCTCSIPSESNNEDIVFTDDYNEVLRHLNDIDNTLTLNDDYIFDKSPADEVEETSNSSNVSTQESDSHSSSSSEEYYDDKSEEYEDDEDEEEEEEGKEIESIEEANDDQLETIKDDENEEENEEHEEEEKKITQLPPKISTFPKGRRMPHLLRLTPEDIELTSYPSIREESSKKDEPCNNTQVRGCLDGERKLPVGGSWSRGPCVACRCMAPGYSECNITQCHGLQNCPEDRRFYTAGACCPICKEDTPVPVFIERPHESRSTSRVPTELLPFKTSTNTLKDEELRRKEEAIITSIQKDEQPHLLSILVPMGIICGICAFLFVIFWRKYHSDKYDINSYRPEEKQKLRPVKTLSDDNSLMGHVC